VFWALVVVAFLGLAAQLTMPERVEPLVFHDEGAGYARGALASTPAPPATSRARS
jgi:hypothetical protein